MTSSRENLKSDLLSRLEQALTVDEANVLANEFIEYSLDPRERVHNIVFYELLPLSQIAEYLGNSKTIIQHTGSNERFDGIIYFENKSTGQKVEITAAIDGYNDALQMELLDERGHAPAFQTIQASGTKRRRKFGENKIRAIRTKDYDWNILYPRFDAALRKKVTTSKNYSY